MFKTHSLSKRLAFLVIVSVLPALAILFYSGLEYRKESTQQAKGKVLQITQTMANTQLNMANTTRQLLSTLSLIPAIQSSNAEACNKIFQDILKQNPLFHNISLSDTKGNVIASGQPLKALNISDRKHFREALENKSFSTGEYIRTRISTEVSAFSFSYPVRNNTGQIQTVLSAIINLTNSTTFFNLQDLPEKSFIAITDHMGIRIFYYPPQKETNPIGKPIKRSSWEIAIKAKESGIFTGKGSDGLKRVFAFEQIRLDHDKVPYLYVWAAIPEKHILTPVNAKLLRNILLLFTATSISIIIAWLVGQKTETLITSLEQALNEIKTLSGLLPICSSCKKIRDDSGYWTQIESYVSKHTEADFSHSICPDCMDKLYGNEDWFNKEKLTKN